MGAKKVFEEAINKAVEEIMETAIEEWDVKNGTGLKYISRQIKQAGWKEDPLKAFQELNSLLNEIGNGQMLKEGVRPLLGRLILLVIHYCNCYHYDPDECAKFALQRLPLYLQKS